MFAPCNQCDLHVASADSRWSMPLFSGRQRSATRTRISILFPDLRIRALLFAIPQCSKRRGQQMEAANRHHNDGTMAASDAQTVRPEWRVLSRRKTYRSHILLRFARTNYAGIVSYFFHGVVTRFVDHQHQSTCNRNASYIGSGMDQPAVLTGSSMSSPATAIRIRRLATNIFSTPAESMFTAISATSALRTCTRT